MKCTECSHDMEMVILEKSGPVWICDNCGLTLNDGTSSLSVAVYTTSN